MSCVLVGVGGGVAAYKAATLVSRLAQSGHEIHVVMTAAGESFVGRATFAALSGNPVITESFLPDHMPLGPHIELAKDADLLVVAPATADLIGKFACGIADSLLPTLYLQIECSVLVAPAMSNAMWEKPSVQRNIAQLAADGVHIIGPEEGWLSCRQRGTGRMSEPDSILVRIQQLLGRQDA